MLDELDSIEKELNMYLPQYLDNQKSTITDNKILKQVLRDPDAYNTVPSREKVLNQAIELEDSISKLNKDL